MNTTNTTQMIHPFANLLREAFLRVEKRKTSKGKGNSKLDLNVLAGSSARKRELNEKITATEQDQELQLSPKPLQLENPIYFCLGCPEKFAKRANFLMHKKICPGRDQAKIQAFLSANNAKRSKGDIILCFCTNTEKQAQADDDGPMVQCDWCEAWLHLQCLPSNKVPSYLYYCDRCIEQYSNPEADLANLNLNGDIVNTDPTPNKKSKSVTFNIHPELDSDPPLDNLAEYTNFQPLHSDQALSTPVPSTYPQTTSNFMVDSLNNLVSNTDPVYMFHSNAYNSEMNSEFLSESFIPSSIADNNDFLTNAILFGDGANLLNSFDILNTLNNNNNNTASVFQPVFSEPNNVMNPVSVTTSITKQNQPESTKPSNLEPRQTTQEILQVPSTLDNNENNPNELPSSRHSPYPELPPFDSLEFGLSPTLRST